MTIKNGCFYAFVDWLSDRMDLIGATTLGLALPQVSTTSLSCLYSFYFCLASKESYEKQDRGTGLLVASTIV